MNGADPQKATSSRIVILANHVEIHICQKRKGGESLSPLFFNPSVFEFLRLV
ncbi:hypothetical protein HMPREF9374_3795 [Desmospora sp. 8437]|nr:hypothetical protein HMPREF9374_3795 [Desmospora sp. 8437]